MGKKGTTNTITSGTIVTKNIYDTHRQIKNIVESYKNINYTVNDISIKILGDWVGQGRNEFKSQYNLLIRKIDDFGDLLQEIYDALVQAEADYQTADNDIKQEYVKTIEKMEGKA